MATWKRLTSMDNTSVDVNLENVAYIASYGDHTALYFIGGRSDGGKVLSVSVKEKADEIHLAKPLRSASSS